MDYKTVLIHNTQLSGFFFRLQNVHALPIKQNSAEVKFAKHAVQTDY